MATTFAGIQTLVTCTETAECTSPEALAAFQTAFPDDLTVDPEMVCATANLVDELTGAVLSSYNACAYSTVCLLPSDATLEAGQYISVECPEATEGATEAATEGTTEGTTEAATEDASAGLAEELAQAMNEAAST